jgi:DeoR/GlpR family transcriptional regulator of sugar metabolism
MPANKKDYKSISLHNTTYWLLAELSPKMGLKQPSSIPRVISILAEQKELEFIMLGGQLSGN